MVKTKEQIMEQLKTHFAEATSDDVLTLLEDVADTLDAGKDSTDWKKKYDDSEAEWKKKLEDKDAEWRKKYKDRFFNTPAKDEPEKPPEGSDDKPKSYEYKDLFKEESK